MSEDQVYFDELDSERDQLFETIRNLLFEQKVIPQVIAAVAGQLLVYALAEVYTETGQDVIVPITSGLLRQYWQLKTEIDAEPEETDANVPGGTDADQIP